MWAYDPGLGINPVKTEVVLFTRRYKPSSFRPLKLNGTELKLKQEAHFLGLILGRKLSCKLNVINRIKKASIVLYACNRVLGRKWVLGSRMTHRIYTAVVRPILTYECLAWWEYLDRNTNSKLIQRLQRSARIIISGALRITPTSALETILGLISLALFCRGAAVKVSKRLWATGQWHDSDIGHAMFLREV